VNMPKPGEAHAQLQKLVGRWEGGETLHPAPWDPIGGPAVAHIENRVVLGGFAVVQEYQQTRNGAPNFAGHGVFWWDPVAGQHAMTWFDAMSGTPTEYRGRFEDDVLRLTHAIPEGGFSRCTFDCRTRGRYSFKLEVSADGETWAPSMEGAYARMPAAVAGKSIARAPGKATRTKPAPKPRPAAKTRAASAPKKSSRRGSADPRPRRPANGRGAARGGRGRRGR
jgi:hypothetical protein